MGSQEALLAEASIGLAIAAPIGPMAIVVIRRTLVNGFFAGLTTGAGASTTHLLYATFAVCGLNHIAVYLQANRKLIDIVIALSLIAFGLRMLRRRACGPDSRPQIGRSMMRNYASAVALCLVNPMTFALLLSAIAAIVRHSSNDASGTSSLAAGVFAGSIAWWFCLVGATTLIGIRLSPRSMRTIDVIAGTIMFSLAISTIFRAI